MTTDRIETSDGTGLHLQKWSSDDAHATLLIVHGVSEHIGRYPHVARFFTAHGYDVHGYDHRGHGKSGGPRHDVDRFERFVEDLAVVVERVRHPARPFVIYGHSMGGLISALHAESDRPQPDAYVLSAPALDAVVPAVLRMAARILSKIAPRVRAKSGIKGAQLSRDPAVGEAYFADPLVDLRSTARFGAAILGAMTEARAAVNRIRVPALAIHGTDDTLVPPSASAPLAAVAGIDRKLFPGLRHELHNEPESEDVLGYVAQWIGEHISPT